MKIQHSAELLSWLRRRRIPNQKQSRFIDRFSKYYTPAVLIFSIVVWLFSRDVELAITILVLGCPGALVIGVPVSHVAGIGNRARNGVLLRAVK